MALAATVRVADSEVHRPGDVEGARFALGQVTAIGRGPVVLVGEVFDVGAQGQLLLVGAEAVAGTDIEAVPGRDAAVVASG
ncbi:hypothetical protein D3C84_620210 [compost metagenome]